MHEQIRAAAAGSAEKPVRVGVIGVGIMGSNHARVLAELPGVEVVGIADPGAAHRPLLAEILGCQACDDTESLLSLDTWEDIAAQNLPLQHLQADVEALLVNRISHPHQYFIAPIDSCYELVGIIRRYWRGFSGGDEVWESIPAFFKSLQPYAPAEG